MEAAISFDSDGFDSEINWAVKNSILFGTK